MGPFAARLALSTLLAAPLIGCGGDDGAASTDAQPEDIAAPADTAAVDNGSGDDTSVADTDAYELESWINQDDADPDGDGYTVAEEAIAGTSEGDPSSAPGWHPEITARPRLYFGEADLPTLRDLRDTEDGAALWARITADANRTIPDVAGDPWEDATAQHRGWIAEAAAFVGLLEGPDAGRPFTDRAIALLAEPLPDPWPLNEGIYPDSKYDLREAEALVAACHAYDLLAGTPGLSSRDLEDAHATLTQRVEDFAGIHLEPGAFNTFLLLAQNNHMMKVMGALGVCAVALPDRPGAAYQFNEAISALTYMLLDFQGNAEGGYAEGWNYLAYGGQSWLPLIWTYRRLVGPGGAWSLKCNASASLEDPRADTVADYTDLAALDTVVNIFDNALRTARPDGLMVPTDDANAVPLHGAILGALFDRPAWLWNWRKPAVNRYSNAAHVLSFAALASAPEAAPPTFELDGAFPEAGFVNLRSDWSAEATYLHMLVEHDLVRENGLGHEHADSLSILLHAHGEPLALDPGYINFDHHELVKHGKDHNIVLIDGEGPRFPFSVTAPIGDAWLEDWQPDAARTSALGRTHFADTAWWRRVVRVDGAWFLVADRLRNDDGAGHTYTFVLNGNGGGEVPDGAFALGEDGATWTRPAASLRAVVQPTEGAATYAERLEEHAPAWGQQRLHSCLDVHADMGPDAGFLSVLWPAATDAATPTFTVTPGDDGRAELRVDHPDGAYEIATLTVASPAQLALRRYDAEGALEREDSWAMETADAE